jgi:hypothetical protein
MFVLLIVHFIGMQPKHVTIGLFEVIEITCQAMAMKLRALLNRYGSKKKFLAYMKDEGVNLGALTTTLK